MQRTRGSHRSIAACSRRNAYSRPSGSTPRVAKMRATVSPILLLGVLAPAVTPMRTGPAGSQSVDADFGRAADGTVSNRPRRRRSRQLGILDVVRRHARGADRRQRDRVARVVSADDEHDVERLLEQRLDRVLTVLRRAADRVERAEVGSPIGIPTAPARAPARSRSAIAKRLAREHRRLVGDADALEVAVGIELGRRRRGRIAPGTPRDRRAPRYSRTRVAPHPCRERRDSCCPDTWRPATRSRASPRGSTCRG